MNEQRMKLARRGASHGSSVSIFVNSQVIISVYKVYQLMTVAQVI